MTDLNHLIKSFKSKNRRSLAQAITLIESTLENDRSRAREFMARLGASSKPTCRIGITGSPGVGKSTLIENLGSRFTQNGLEICVLAVDPSSPRSGGSILGDKTRMSKLANDPKAYVRPSPTGNAQGGVAQRTHDVIRVCEAFGFDLIIIETVGVGQTELAVASMVDLIFLMLLPLAGDELQGIKKGVMECADVILVNKDDLDPVGAQRIVSQCQSALELFRPRWEHWKVPVMGGSANNPSTIDRLISEFESYKATLKKHGSWIQQRRNQELNWLRQEIRQRLMRLTLDNQNYSSKIKSLESDFLESHKDSEDVIQAILKIVGFTIS